MTQKDRLTPTQDVSIIIEWENVMLSEADRALLMLQRLREQMALSHRRFEVILVFNDQEIDRASVEEALNKSEQSHRTLGVNEAKQASTWRIEPVSGCHYYEIKNAGAKMSAGDIIVFLDSDVIPDDGWLEGLIEPMLDDPNIQVMAGNTYLTPQGLVGKAFALGWFFPLKNTHTTKINKQHHFFANNVAFRRACFEQFDFPKMPPGMTRGACVKLAKILTEHGVIIYTNPLAQTSHPSPNGAAHIWTRALASGRDRFLRDQDQGLTMMQCIRSSLGHCISASVRMWRRTRAHGHSVGLAKLEYPAAVLFMVAWYATSIAATFATALAPNWARARWRI